MEAFNVRLGPSEGGGAVDLSLLCELSLCGMEQTRTWTLHSSLQGDVSCHFKGWDGVCPTDISTPLSPSGHAHPLGIISDVVPASVFHHVRFPCEPNPSKASTYWDTVRIRTSVT